MEPIYFFTKDWPHQWAGQQIVTLNTAENYEPFKSLEEARVCAAIEQVGRPGEERYCQTNYGVMYRTEN